MSGHRFTLAEDDADLLFFMHRMLSKLYPDSSIASFSNAEDAFRHILDTGTEILVTNHGMGKMSGTQLVQALRDRGFQIPIIMISGNPAAKPEAMAAGATEFLDKHADAKVLEQHILRLIPDGGNVGA
jgi:DNA-binding NtrC family response regulator